MDEVAQRGAKALAKFLGMPIDTLNHKLLPDMKRCGVVIEWVEGRPPRKALLWWPSIVQRYMMVWQRQKYPENNKP